MAGSAVPDARLEHLAAYLVELALCEAGALHFLPSCIAAAAVLVAQFSLDVRVWSPTLEHYTHYGPTDLQVLSQLCAECVIGGTASSAECADGAEQHCMRV
jgi:Cyclin, C-terminal domain